MLAFIKRLLQRIRDETSVSDKLQLGGLLLAVVTLAFVYFQVKENTRTNIVAIRGQLYQTEAGMAGNEATTAKEVLSTVWLQVPLQVTGDQFKTTLLQTERVNDFETPGCINLVSKGCDLSRGRSPVLVG